MKPRKGFKWALSSKAKLQKSQILREHPQMKPFWSALRVRLIQTGHREGTRAPFMDDSNAYIYSTEIDDLATLQVLYTILVDTLTIQSIRIKPE